MTPEEQRVDFIRAVNVAINKGAFKDARYSDQETNFALYYVAESWPDVTPELVQSAWTAFEGQFNGANRAKAKAQWEKSIRAHYGE